MKMKWLRIMGILCLAIALTACSGNAETASEKEVPIESVKAVTESAAAAIDMNTFTPAPAEGPAADYSNPYDLTDEEAIEMGSFIYDHYIVEYKKIEGTYFSEDWTDEYYSKEDIINYVCLLNLRYPTVFPERVSSLDDSNLGWLNGLYRLFDNANMSTSYRTGENHLFPYSLFIKEGRLEKRLLEELEKEFADATLAHADQTKRYEYWGKVFKLVIDREETLKDWAVFNYETLYETIFCQLAYSVAVYGEDSLPAEYVFDGTGGAILFFYDALSNAIASDTQMQSKGLNQTEQESFRCCLGSLYWEYMATFCRLEGVYENGERDYADELTDEGRARFLGNTRARPDELAESLLQFTPIPVEPTPTPYITEIKKTECGHYLHDVETETLLSQGKIGSVGYFFEDDSVSGTYYYVAVKNNTSNPVAIKSKATAKTKNGKTVKCSFEGGVEYLDPGAVSYFSFPFYDVKDVVSVEHTISTAKPEYEYLPCLTDLKMNVYENHYDSTVSVELTNNGSYTKNSPYVVGDVLFFDADNKILGVGWLHYNNQSLQDYDQEIKPGHTVYATSTACQKGDYDHVSVYLYARRRDWSLFPRVKHKTIQTVIPDEQLELEYYSYGEDPWITTFMTVRNKASEDITVDAWQVIRNDAGNIMHVGKGHIEVLAPKQMTILQFSPYIAQSYVGKSEFIVSAGVFSDGSPIKQCNDVIPSLKIDSKVEGREVTVSVKNGHKYSIDSVTINALFFDENDELIDYKWEEFYYKEPKVWGQEKGFPSGKKVTKTLTSDKDFSYVKLFVTHNQTLTKEIRRQLGWNY